jgi:hypothetical protein
MFQAEIAAARHPNLQGLTGFSGELRRELASWGDLFRRGCLNRTIVGTGLM